MTDVQQQAAIRSRVWLGGRFLARDPVPVQITTKRFETKTRTSNLAMRVDRAFTLAGMPNIRNRQEFVLPWPNVPDAGLLEHLDSLAAVGQPFGLGLWKQVYDFFDGDASRTSFLLQRRQLLPSVTPPVTHVDYPTRVIRYSKAYTDPTAVATELTVIRKTTATIGTGTPAAGEAWVEDEGHLIGNLWVSTLRVGTAPAALHDVLVAIYLPLYMVLIDADSQRSYAQALVEPRALRFIEFG